MNISTVIANIIEIDVPIVLIGVFEDEENQVSIDFSDSFSKLIKEVIELGDFEGKKGDFSVLYTQGVIKSPRIMLVGLGKEDKHNLENIRKTLGNASRKVRDLGTGKLAVNLDHFIGNELNKEKATEAIIQGMIMGSYQNLTYRTKDLDKYKHLEEVVVFSSKTEESVLRKGAESGKIIAESVNFCRSLAWGPANYITPTKLAEEAERLSKELGVKTIIFEREEAEKVGLHSFIAVAKGTDEPPKFIIMEYGADKKDVDTVAIIGKAITFDSGGISIKPSLGMERMKCDMTGGAVVFAAMEAIARLDINLHVVAIVPATDNMPSGKAYHPGDVIKSYSGQTIEVISTDAEGRMVLNDALTYAAKNYQPKVMFDFATLTGAITIALGEHAIGYFANDDKVAEKLEKASKTSGDAVWRMPLWEVYDQQLKSSVADMKHSGGRMGGAITAARFLSKFVMDVPWAHLDIAGSMEQTRDKDYNPAGSRGAGVRLIIDVLRNWTDN